MRSLILGLVFSLAALAGGASVAAQEGHPLKGSWIGTWDGNKAQGNDVLVILNWDGKAITGMINPGTDNMEIKNATLNPDGWQVHLEADLKDKSGKVVNTYVIDGKIENLAFHNRSVTGTWRSQSGKGAFKISRQ
jgi:hypothetical protein